MACYVFKFPVEDSVVYKDAYKVGKANDVDQRHSNLASAYPAEITERWMLYPTLDKIYSSGTLFFIERTIHKLLESDRILKNREFFRISDIEACIKRIIDHFKDIGFDIRVTRSVEDLKDLHDYSVDDSLEEMRQKPKQIVELVVLNPYPHQVEILEKIIMWYKSDETSGKLILPPGIGKSYITSFWLRDLPEETKVLVLVPYRIILDDFTNALEKCHVKCKVEVLVNNTAWQGIEEKYDIIVYDEAHHMCSKENSKLLQLGSKKKLFLTATEKTIESKDNGEEVLDMNDAVFGNYIYQMGILEAIQKNLLVDYKIYLADDWKLGLKDVINQLKDVYHRRKILMFFNSIPETEKVCKQLNELEFQTSIITADTNKELRRTIINKFTADEFHILCNVACIGEGADIPCIDTIMFMESRGSNIGVIQNIGRGLRLHPDKDFCMVIVDEQMLKKKFIENLYVYDQRMINPRGMIISNKSSSVKEKEDLDYSVEGIVRIVEKYTSKGLNETEIFIKKLKNLNIYSETEYRKRFNELDGFPEFPDVELNKFSWDLLIKCKEPYDYEECISRILELMPAELDNLKEIASKKDKLIHLYKIDNKIDVSLFGKLREDKRLGGLLATSIIRRTIK